MRATGDKTLTCKFGCRARLPIILLLLQSNSTGYGCIGATLAKSLSNDFSISSTNIGSVSSLTALFQLGCEYGDSDSYQHGLLPLKAISTVSC